MKSSTFTSPTSTTITDYKNYFTRFTDSKLNSLTVYFSFMRTKPTKIKSFHFHLPLSTVIPLPSLSLPTYTSRNFPEGMKFLTNKNFLTNLAGLDTRLVESPLPFFISFFFFFPHFYTDDDDEDDLLLFHSKTQINLISKN